MKHDKPFIEYLNMGPWPVYVGCTNDVKAFDREMQRIAPGQGVKFHPNEDSGATTHFFCHQGMLTFIVTIRPEHADATPDSLYGLLAHEAMHIVQHMREELIAGHCREGLGIEAEAYLIQYIVQGIGLILTDADRKLRDRKPSSKEQANGNTEAGT